MNRLLEKSTKGKEQVIHYLTSLQQEIIEVFSSFEDANLFQVTPWDYAKGEGGGVMAVLRGSIFEKAAVNRSGVYGSQFPASQALKDEAPVCSSEKEAPFFATGVSLITHMANPYAPTAHLNVRYIETEEGYWFGGGYDLTPMGFSFEEDTRHFHEQAQKALAPFGDMLYNEYSKWAKEYFFIPHRNKERGVGGIFFDRVNSGDFSRDFSLLQSVGNSFLNAYIPVLEKRIHTPFTEEEKALQKKYRGHYAEFNLIYDRGTRFGFLSGGNPEAILCSMPPEASW